MSAAPTGRPKLIYFAERPKGVDPEGFTARWRQHARLGMSQPRWRNIERYVHCDALRVAGTALPLAGCDGVAMVWYRSEETRLAHIADRDAGPVMKRDEAETFARPVREVAALCEEDVLCPLRQARYKLFLRLWAPEGQDREEFQAVWLERFAPRLLDNLDAAGASRGYVQNQARGEDAAQGVPPPVCDGIAEIACDNPQATAVAVRLALDEVAGCYGAADAVWTAETVLFAR